jgi:hypothetical protein
MRFLREFVVSVLVVAAITTMPLGILLAVWRRNIAWFNLTWLSVVLIVVLLIFGGITGGRIFTSRLGHKD